MNTTEKNIASHIAAAIAVVLAIVAAVHPGFKLADPAFLASIPTIGAIIIESINTFFHKSNAQKYAIVKALAVKSVADLVTTAPVASATPLTTPTA